MANFRLLLIRLKIHRLLGPFVNLFLKIGNFGRLSAWIHQNRKLEFNDFYTGASEYNDRYKLYQFILQKETREEAINYLEFGVADGETILWWSEKLKNENSRLHGFDTFEGLPEDWGVHKKGSFSNQGVVPEISDKRLKFYKGLFQETLVNFLSTLDKTKKNVILLDADLYSSTMFVLATMSPFLKKDDIIIFDEFLSSQHEFLAYLNFTQTFSNIELKPFAAANNYSFVAFKVCGK